MQLDTLTLNGYWSNEFDYEPVAQEQARSVTGALVTWERAQPMGAPVTLADCWMPRADLLTLQSKRQAAASPMTLTLDDGRQFTVLFDRGQKSIEATPIDGPFTVPASTDRYNVTLHLLMTAAL